MKERELKEEYAYVEMAFNETDQKYKKVSDGVISLKKEIQASQKELDKYEEESSQDYVEVA